MEAKQDALRATIICTVVLFVKFLYVTFAQGGERFKLGFAGDQYGEAGGRPPEDVKFGMHKPPNGEALSAEAVKRAKERLNRLTRLVWNDLENIPFALFMAWGSLLCIASAGDFEEWLHIGAIAAFTASRILHTVSYIKALQPWRTVGYMVGLLAIFVMGVNGTIASF